MSDPDNFDKSVMLERHHKPFLVVNGPRPDVPVTVYYAASPADLQQLLQGFWPLPWEDMALDQRDRSRWMSAMAAACSAVDAEGGGYSAFADVNGRMVIICETTPPTVVVELPFRVSVGLPEVSRPILGPDGSRLN